MRTRLPFVIIIAMLVLAGLACAQSGEILTAAEATERAAGGPPPTAEEGEEGEAEETQEGPASTFSVGDTVYITGRAFLVNIFDAAGSRRISAGQERGVEVTILQVTDVDGVSWYQIDAPTGTGWLPEENLSAEPPQ
jgi:hypothetical protein